MELISINNDILINILNFLNDDKTKLYFIFKNKDLYKRRSEFRLDKYYYYSNFVKNKCVHKIKEYYITKFIYGIPKEESRYILLQHAMTELPKLVYNISKQIITKNNNNLYQLKNIGETFEEKNNYSDIQFLPKTCVKLNLSNGCKKDMLNHIPKNIIKLTLNENFKTETIPEHITSLNYYDTTLFTHEFKNIKSLKSNGIFCMYNQNKFPNLKKLKLLIDDDTYFENNENIEILIIILIFLN